MPRPGLDRVGSARHSPPMRWLLLINLLAVVLLSGAVAIVIEGTPVGTAPSPMIEREQVSPDPDGEQQASNKAPTPPAESDNIALKEPDADESAAGESFVAAPNAPIPRPAPRSADTGDVEGGRTPVGPTAQTAVETASRPTLSAELPPLRVATEGDFAPFNFVDAAGEPAGFDIDVAMELCRRLNRECRYEVRPWAELIPALRRAEIDLVAASMRIPSSRPAGVLFSNPYYGSRGRFVAPRDAGIARPGLLLTDGSQIAVQGETVHEAYLIAQDADVELVKTRSLMAALQLVADGKVEAAFGDNAAILRWMKDKTCCVALGSPVSDETYFGEGIGLVVRESEEALLDDLNTHLELIQEDGTSATISERYFGGSIY